MIFTSENVRYMSLNKHIKNHIVWSKDDNISEIFERIFEKNLWQSNESVSGKGSEILATKNILEQLPDLLNKYQIKTVTDAPCGDFNWMKHLDYRFEKYTGIDIVKKIIESNKIFETNSIKFYAANIIDCSLEKTDLILCRDCFIHLTYYQISKAMQNFKNSHSKYLLTNTYETDKNTDVLTGQYRKINLFLPPFNFPKPLDIIEEDPQDKKYIALWRQEDLCL